MGISCNFVLGRKNPENTKRIWANAELTVERGQFVLYHMVDYSVYAQRKRP